MVFKYFDAAESQQFSFFQVPKLLFTEDIFKNLSSDAKILYGIMLDRMFLSVKNGWIDDDGHAFIIFTIEEIKEYLNCSNDKATKLVKELENIGLIEKRRLGQGKPTKIYVKDFNSFEKSKLNENQNSDFQNSENRNSRNSNIGIQEFRKSESNNTNNKDTDIRDTEYNIPSPTSPKNEIEKEESDIDFNQIMDLYNQTCKSYNPISKIVNYQKNEIIKRFDEGYTIDDFKKLFELAEESKYLKGNNDSNWKAGFDWLIKEANMSKTLSGKYKNREIPNNPSRLDPVPEDIPASEYLRYIYGAYDDDD